MVEFSFFCITSNLLRSGKKFFKSKELFKRNNIERCLENVQPPLILKTVFFLSPTMVIYTQNAQQMTIGEFHGVPQIPKVMETILTLPGPIVRSLLPACSPPPTRASPTTRAPGFTMM